ncbi:MAG TPA: hypothetical protein VFE78_01875 [Gemmataceae bacterium]|jgi:hypothetical protein|nr:hypothetical protein [Gemmataceae bacterium]
MPRCPSCDYPLPSDRERLGARCPNCRDPLYEPPGRYGRPARDGEGACAAHPGVEVVGTCARCGNYLCEVCRTRWRDGILCAACVDRALGSGEAPPEQKRAQLRQVLLSLGLGVAAWGLSFAAWLLAVLVTGASGQLNFGLVFLMVVVFLGDMILAALGLGQAAAALRARGNAMILATVGLVLNGLYLGALLGLFTFTIWQS